MSGFAWPYLQSYPILLDFVSDHYFDFIANPRDAVFDDPPDLSAFAEESLRQAVVYLCDRAAWFARLGDFDDRFAYAKSRAGFESIEADVFSEEVSAQASGWDLKAFVLYLAQGFNGEQADLAIWVAPGVAVAAQPVTGDQFRGFDRSFAFALQRLDIYSDQFSNQSIHPESGPDFSLSITGIKDGQSDCSAN
jgi:hypothetical protein